MLCKPPTFGASDWKRNSRECFHRLLPWIVDWPALCVDNESTVFCSETVLSNGAVCSRLQECNTWAITSVEFMRGVGWTVRKDGRILNTVQDEWAAVARDKVRTCEYLWWIATTGGILMMTAKNSGSDSSHERSRPTKTTKPATKALVIGITHECSQHKCLKFSRGAHHFCVKGKLTRTVTRTSTCITTDTWLEQNNEFGHPYCLNLKTLPYACFRLILDQFVCATIGDMVFIYLDRDNDEVFASICTRNVILTREKSWLDHITK